MLWTGDGQLFVRQVVICLLEKTKEGLRSTVNYKVSRQHGLLENIFFKSGNLETCHFTATPRICSIFLRNNLLHYFINKEFHIN